MKDGKLLSSVKKCENELIIMSRAWDKKKKIWVPDRIRTYDLTKHWASALSTWATEEFMESEAIY